MIIYNTTYHVQDSVTEKFIGWLREVYIPEAVKSGILTEPRLMLVMARQDGDEGSSYSLQFCANSVDDLEKWYAVTGQKLVQEMQAKFNNRVAGFTTLMNVLDL